METAESNSSTTRTFNDLPPFQRLLMGPGPSNVHPRVLEAMAKPLVGHLDPEFLKIMDEIQAMLQEVFRTKNRFTISVSGTGSAGMEAAICNVIERGDKIIVGINGVFGTRLADVSKRYGAEVLEVKAPWGEIVPPDAIRDALADNPGVKAVVVVHAETSTGIHQPLEELSELTHKAGALFIVDTVTSLAGTEVSVDDWEIDVCYSGTQKCLSCPPGLAPLTFGDRTMEVMHQRKSPVESWYLDMTMIEKYWGSDRAYHHTAPISMNYALREALRIILEEGLQPRWARHRLHHEALKTGLEALGLRFVAQEGHRLPMLNSVAFPDGTDEAAVRKTLLNDYNIEIGPGLGPFKGKVWRVGLMGESCRKSSVISLLAALGEIFARDGKVTDSGLGISAALEAYADRE